MKREQANEDIIKAFDEYDAGRIPADAFKSIVTETTDRLYTTGYLDGQDSMDYDEEDDDEVLFEAEMDLDEWNTEDLDDNEE